MELAGIVGMDAPQEGIRPDLLKYILVRSQEASEPQPGRTSFWVFNQSHQVAVPAAASVEPQGQHGETVPEDTAVEVSAEPQGQSVEDEMTAQVSFTSQRSITDYFSPCPSARHGSSAAPRVSPAHSFIRPCPSVTLAEVPVVFQVHSDGIAQDYLDPTNPLFEREVPKSSSSELPSFETPPEVHPEREKVIEDRKRARTYSSPSLFATWNDCMAPSTSVSPAQLSQSSLDALPGPYEKKLPFECRSLPPCFDDTDSIIEFPAEYDEVDDPEVDVEKHWIEKDNDRLAVIADLNRTIAGMKKEVANTATAFQKVTAANHKLQDHLGKKKKTIREMESSVGDLLHNLDAGDTEKEKLESDLAHNRTQCQRKMTEMKSEKDFLEAQLRQRCESVDRLTRTLSRVADFDRWKDIKEDLDVIQTEAGKAQAAWDELMTQHKILSQDRDQLLAQNAFFEANRDEIYKRTVREARRKCKGKTASEKDLKKCLRAVFERLVRCTLCLGKNGYEKFDTKHQALYEQVLKLTGEDYQTPLIAYYDVYSILEEFNLIEVGAEGAVEDQEEEPIYDHGGDLGDEGAVDDDEAELFYDQGGELSEEQREIHGNDEEYTQGFSFTFTLSMAGVDNVNGTAAGEQNVEWLPGIQDAWSQHEVAHTHEPQEGSQTAVDQATPTATNQFGVSKDQREHTSGNIWQGLYNSSPTNPEPESSNGPALPARIFLLNDLPTPAAGGDGANVGNPFEFGFSTSSSSNLFGTLASSFETMSGEESPRTMGKTKLTERATHSTAENDIWHNTSFTTGGATPFVLYPRSAAGFEANPDERDSIFKNLPPSTSPPPEETTPVSQDLIPNQSTEATEALEEAQPSMAREALFPTQSQGFTFSPAAPIPYGGQNFPSRTVQAEEKGGEDKGASVGNHREEGSTKTEAAEEKVTKKDPLDVDSQKPEPPLEQTPENTTLSQEYLQHRAPPPTLAPAFRLRLPSFGVYFEIWGRLLGY